jgi:hypothetical protein
MRKSRQLVARITAQALRLDRVPVSPITRAVSAQRLQRHTGMAGSLLVVGHFDMFERPDQILYGRFGVSIPVNTHWRLLIFVLCSVRPPLLRMGKMHQQ